MHFVVYLTEPIDVVSGQILQFDTTMSNVGESYDESTHKFRPPYNGTYEFTLEIMTNQQSNARAEITVNGQRLCLAGTDPGKTVIGRNLNVLYIFSIAITFTVFIFKGITKL